MTTYNDTDLIAAIQKLSKAGKPNKVIRAALMFKYEIEDDARISQLLKDAGIGRSTSGWTQSDTLQFLGDGVSEYDLFAKVIEEKAGNEARWINDRKKVRVLLNTVYSNLGSPVTEKAGTEAQIAQLKALIPAKK
jgi:hypothetical protein